MVSIISKSVNIINIKIIVGIIYIFLLYFSNIIQIISSNYFINTYFNLTIGIIISFFTIYDIKIKKLFELNLLFIPLFLIFIIFHFILFHDNFNLNYKYYYEIISCLIIFLFFFYVSQELNPYKPFLCTFIFCILINQLVALVGFIKLDILNIFSSLPYQVGTYGFDKLTFRTGGFKGENYTALWNSINLIFGTYLLTSKSIIKKFIGLFLLFLSIFIIHISLSRNSYLASFICYLMTLFFLFKNNKIQKYQNLLLFIFLYLFIFLISYYLYEYHLYSINNNSTDNHYRFSKIGILDIRLVLWFEYLKEFYFQCLPINCGLSYLDNSDNFKLNYIPHNTYIDIVIRFGLTFLVFYLLPTFFIIRFIFFSSSYRQFDVSFIYPLASICASISLFFLSFPFMKFYFVLLGISMGIIKKNENYK